MTFNGILSAAENLIRQGFRPENDVYFAFSGGEEINGPGAEHIVAYFREQGIALKMVLDEGGAVVEDVFPGVKGQCALIGIAEKGLLNLEYTVSGAGGHASAPTPHTPVGKLSLACAAVEAHPFKMHVTEPVAQMFDTLGRRSSFLYRMIFANMWAFGWVLDLLTRKTGGELNALLRTTVAFTQMRGSKAPNVIPPTASMVSNLRLNPADSKECCSESVNNGGHWVEHIEAHVFLRYDPEIICDWCSIHPELNAKTNQHLQISVLCGQSRYYYSTPQ